MHATGKAGLHVLRRLDAGAIELWLGPMPGHVAFALLDLTQGYPGEIDELWAIWLRRGLLTRDEQGAWLPAREFVDEAASVVESVSRQLSAWVGTTDLATLHRMRLALATGALEGIVFTAAATAAASGWNDDELIDVLDERLVHGDGHSQGILVRMSPARVPVYGAEDRLLRRYQFANRLTWRIVASRFASDQERPALAGQLALSLESLYGAALEPLLPTLSALWAAAGSRETAAHYGRLARFGLSKDVLRTEAVRVADASTEDWPVWRLRRAAELLLHAAEALRPSNDPTELARIIDAGEDLSRRSSYEYGVREANLLRAMGYLKTGGQASDVDRWLSVARAADLDDLVATEAALITARVLVDRDKAREARPHAEWAVSAARRRRRPRQEANGHFYLGQVALRLNNDKEAERETRTALTLARAWKALPLQSECLQQLGRIASKAGAYDDARRWLHEAISMMVTLRDRSNEAASWTELARVELGAGDPDASEQAALHAIDRARVCGNRHAESVAEFWLAAIWKIRGAFARARDHANRALHIARGMENRELEHAVQEFMSSLGG